MPTPTELVAAHQRSIMDLLAKIRADQGCIRQLLIGRHCTSTRRPGPIWKITEVKVMGAGVEIWGAVDHVKRLLARGLTEIVIVMNTPSNKEEGHENAK